jgi:cytochrome c
MEDRFNTISGWALGAGIAALGLYLLSAEYFHHEPVEGGYAVASAEGAETTTAAAVPIDWTKADVAKGAEVFKQCAACHNATAGGANGTGPNLHALLGKAKASVAGFAYSEALKTKGGSWTFEDLDAWLLSPRKYASGTKMTYAGLSDNDKRASVIAYLNSQGSNLPLPANKPAAAAAPAPEAGAKAAEATPAAAANAAAPAENVAAPAAK